MRGLGTVRGGEGDSASPVVLLFTATVVLFLFTYLGRADSLATRFPGRDWQVVSGGALPPTAHVVIAALLLGILPVLVAGRFFRLRDLGLGLGVPGTGLRWLAAGVPLAVVAGHIAAASPSMRAVYPLSDLVAGDIVGFRGYALSAFLYYGSWEVLFRGVLLFGLKDRLGTGGANALQTALSVTAHFGRPLTETFSAIPAGFVFGWIDLRTKSVWYVAVIHWIVGMSMEWFILAT